MRRLFVISDLHLGGRPDARDAKGNVTPGSQICNAYPELVAFIRWLTTQGADVAPADLELVINGDLVDFLADDGEDDASLRAQIWTANEDDVIRKLDRIVWRARVDLYDGVFQALRDFLAGGHRLTLLLGNHDVELALPAVRRHLTELLGGEGVRLKFIYDGEAYAVGPVLIEHGNRYDPWNAINHSTLRQERSMLSRGLRPNEKERKDLYFVVPAGTYLVIHFMNRIKSRYRFIDLLKPETNAVVPLLLALEPDYRPDLDAIVRAGPIARDVLRRVLGPRQREAAVPTRDRGGLLSDHAAEKGEAARSRGDELVNRAVSQPPAGSRLPAEERNPWEDVIADQDVSLDDVLAQTLKPEDLPFFRVTPAEHGHPLSFHESVDRAVNWLSARVKVLTEKAGSASAYFHVAEARTDAQRLRQLHAALAQLTCGDASFDLGKELSGYEDAARDTAKSGGFQVVTYGHTHLPKQISLVERGSGPPWYFNTGTWCDVMRLPAAIAEKYDTAREKVLDFFDAIKQNKFDKYRQRYLTFLQIDLVQQADGSERAEPRLWFYVGAGRKPCDALTSILD
jgi:UDP-2,3-diacylglucosamine pyrophosphatase LpxH